MQSGRLSLLVRTFTSSTPKFTATLTSSEIYFNNRTIDRLLKSGQLHGAVELYDEMPTRDVVTHNIIISGYNQYGFPQRALNVYSNMVSQGIRENESTFSSILSICSKGGFYKEGIQAHCRVIVLGFNLNVYVASSLIGLYMPMGLHHLALAVFDGLPEKNLASWNSVLRGFFELGLARDMFGLFNEMKVGDFEPNGLSFCYLIGVCCKELLLDEGRQLHCQVIKAGWEASNVFIANGLVDFYANCLNLADARKSFNLIPVEDVISWNSIVSVYAHHVLFFDALELFSRMQFWGKRLSIRSMVRLLNMSSEMRNISLGKQMHSLVLKLGFDQESVYVQSALIYMYGKCGDIKCSVFMFECLPEKSLGCCNALMTSLLDLGLLDDMLELFGLMADKRIGYDEITLSTMLKALSRSASGCFAICRSIHGCVVKLGFELYAVASCSLIDAYSREGFVKLSYQVFENISSPNAICFTSMISAYARNGMGRECLKMLEVMISTGVKPDKVTLLSVLGGCSHSGLVEEGRSLFYNMRKCYGVDPERHHYSCMIDLMGRAGLLSEAEELLLQAGEEADCVMWSSLLRSCGVHMNEKVGRRAARKLMELESGDPAVLFQVSNFYSEIGESQLSVQVREIAMTRKVTREIGCSLIEINE